MNATRLAIVSLSLLVVFCVWAASEQDTKPAVPSPRETSTKPLSERERKRKDIQLRKEMETPYRIWLDQDVAWIITDEERAAFNGLHTDDEREQFIEQFWERRNPTPESGSNDFKEEHYRRMAYANERFASGIPGWKTDRGRIYIAYGPPDEIEDHSSGGLYERPAEQGGGSTSTFPFQIWRYRHIEGIDSNVQIEFVDTTMSGEFRRTMDPSDIDALLYVPGAGLTLMEQMGLSDKSQRFNNPNGTHLGQAFGGTPESMNEFTRLKLFTDLQRPPALPVHDRASVDTHINYNILPVKMRADFFPITDATVQTNVTVQFDNKDLQFSNRDGNLKAVVHIHGSVSTLAHRRVADFDEDVAINSPSEYQQEMATRQSIYQKSLPLRPGSYRLALEVRDLTGGNSARPEMAITVPQLNPDKVSTSNLVLADLVERLPMKSLGSGPFVVGDSKVRPRVGEVFQSSEKLWMFLRVYHAASGVVQYELIREGAGDKVVEYSEDLSEAGNASATQVTIAKGLSLQNLAPGRYTIRVTILDANRTSVCAPTEARFIVL